MSEPELSQPIPDHRAPASGNADRSEARPGRLRATIRSQLWTVPNVISATRLLLVPVFAVLIHNEADGLALIVLAVSGATDWLDGFLARRWGQETALGRLLDPAADRLFILVTLLGLASRDIVPWWLVVVIVLRDLVLLGTVPALANRGYRPLPVHFVGKAGTFALLYAFPLLLLATWPGTVGLVAWVLGWAFAIWGVGLYWFAGVLYLRQVRELARPT